MAKAMTAEKRTGQRDRTRSAIPYAASIGVRVSDTQDLIERVEKGFTYGAFENLLGLLELTSAELADLLQIPRRTLTRRKRAGRFATDESERLLRLSRVLDAAVELFEGDRESAVRWLQSSNRALGGGVPLTMAKTEVGALEVENLMGRLEYGVPS